MNKMKMAAAGLAAGLMVTLGAVSVFAAEEAYVCPRGYDECTQNGACVRQECETYNCPQGNETCVQNGACISGCGVQTQTRRGGCCRR